MRVTPLDGLRRMARLGGAVADPPPALPTPSGAAPVVSILVSSYGQASVTRACLASIAQAWPAVPVEVIVFDDASGDPEVPRLADIPGLRLVIGERNVGYGPACNLAAEQARGEYILLLNNDARVAPGWLDAMLAPMRGDASVGAVGAKLLHADGRLQEAGGIIWNDASGWNFGRGDDPARPEYNYVREADYCSAACLLVRRDVFLELGGFDARFAPAYYEDVDLAFRLRARGLRVLYQPRAEIVHLEGMSHGVDTGAGVKAFQLRNQQIFAETWAELLATEHAASGTNVLRARDRARDRPIVLVVDGPVPAADDRALLHTLRDAGCVVKFVPWTPGAPDALCDDGIETLHPAAFDSWLDRFGDAVDRVVLCDAGLPPAVYGAVRLRTRASVAFHVSVSDQRADAAHRGWWRNVDMVLSASPDETRRILALEPNAACRALDAPGGVIGALGLNAPTRPCAAIGRR